jgi:hypothetical protein
MADYNVSLPVRIAEDSTKEDLNLNSARSMNNRLVLETYQKGGLNASISNGFAFVEQKVTIKGLKVLMDVRLSDGTFVRQGSTAYIREEVLHTHAWAQKVFQCDTLPCSFIVADLSNVDFIVPPNGTAA